MRAANVTLIYPHLSKTREDFGPMGVCEKFNTLTTKISKALEKQNASKEQGRT